MSSPTRPLPALDPYVPERGDAGYTVTHYDLDLDYRVSSNRPPGGGVMLLEMLNVLEHFPPGSLEHNSVEYARIVAEAMKRATIDKDRHVGDPRFVEVSVERLTGREYAAGLAVEIRAGVKAQPGIEF